MCCMINVWVIEEGGTGKTTGAKFLASNSPDSAMADSDSISAEITSPFVYKILSNKKTNTMDDFRVHRRNGYYCNMK